VAIRKKLGFVAFIICYGLGVAFGVDREPNHQVGGDGGFEGGDFVVEGEDAVAEGLFAGGAEGVTPLGGEEGGVEAVLETQGFAIADVEGGFGGAGGAAEDEALNEGRFGCGLFKDIARCPCAEAGEEVGGFRAGFEGIEFGAPLGAEIGVFEEELAGHGNIAGELDDGISKLERTVTYMIP